ncbi:MAG: MtnX-like HAD-IB family phosphatase [Bacteroidota bacterium]|nr:MtnX-like HAD-IB family phosphatase [Bacteroidota bacterium]
MHNKLSYMVFTDFDGTISVHDVGDAMFTKFGDGKICEKSFEEYRHGKISARECWRQGCASVPSLSRNELTAFAGSQKIDSGFKPFVEFCEVHRIPVSVVSDGFDAYIDPILAGSGLSHLSRFCNELKFNNNGTIEPIFPHTDAECIQCANCKRNHVVTKAGDEHAIVYIGDGYSDRCPAQFADVVFAKGSLVSFCEMHNITFFLFNSFADVLGKFRALVEKGNPKKRRTAELARKEIFIME